MTGHEISVPVSRNITDSSVFPIPYVNTGCASKKTIP